MESSPSRITKIEAADPSLSIDLMVRVLLAIVLGERRLQAHQPESVDLKP
jgi:hypothetical protein